MKRSDSGKVLIILILILLFAGGSAYFWFFKKPGSVLGQRGIAELAYILKRVESRKAGNIDWNEAILSQSLNQDDAVKTDAESAAIINFFDENSIRVDENALVIIRDFSQLQDGTQLATLEVISGSVQGRISGLQLKVKTPNSITVIDPSGRADDPNRVVVSVNKQGETTVSVLKGQASSSAGDSSQAITTGQSVNIDSSKSMKMGSLPDPPQLLSPNDAMQINAATKEAPVEFSWKPVAQKVHLEVSSDRAFDKPVVNENVEEGNQFTAMLTSGDYFWRAALVDENERHSAFSKTRKFSVIVDESATPSVSTVKEAAQYFVQRVKGTAKISLQGSWKGINAGTPVVAGQEIQTSLPGFVKLHSLEGRPASLELRPETRVVVDELDVDNGVLTSVWRLKQGGVIVVNEPGNQQAPDQTIRVGSALFKFGRNAFGNIPSRVLIEKLGRNDYRVIVLTGRIAKLEGAPNGLQAGESLVGKDGKPTKFVDGIVGVGVSKGKKTVLSVGKQLPLITLKWDEGNANFRVEVARDHSMTKTVLRGETSTRQITVSLPEQGRYFWRIVDANGTRFPVSELVLEPRKTLPNLNSVAKVSAKNEKADVPYVGVPPQLNWTWERNPKAVAYQVEVFDDPGLTQRVFESEKVRTPKLDVVVDVLRSGSYYWRVKQFDFRGRPVGTSPTRQLNLKQPRNLPPLLVFEPKGDTATSREVLTVSGVVTKSGRLSINGQAVSLDASGKFVRRIALKYGENPIAIQLAKPDGTVTIQNHTIIRK